MRLKNTSKGKTVACSSIYVFVLFRCFFVLFWAHKKHLRRRKSLAWRFVLFVVFVLFMLFMCVKNVWVKVACLRFVLFVLFVRVKSFRLKIKTALIPLFILLLTVSYINHSASLHLPHFRMATLVYI